MAGSFTVDSRELVKLAWMKNAGKRMNYALAYAINDTLREVQKEERARVADKFTLRKPEFVLREAAILRFAKPADPNMQGKVFVGQKQRFILGAFERGGSRRAALMESGITPRGRRAAVPMKGNPARQTFASEVPSSLRFASLRLKPVAPNRRKRRKGDVRTRVVTGGGTVDETQGSNTRIKGQQRTFVLKRTKKQPEGGVYQRFGPRRDDIRLLYAFVPNQRVPKKLNFEKVARSVTMQTFQRNLREQVNRSMVFHTGRRS